MLDLSMLKHFILPTEKNGGTPHLLQRSNMWLQVHFFLLVKILVLIFVVSMPTEVFMRADELRIFEQRVIELTNEARVKNNLHPLLQNEMLVQSSSEKTFEILNQKKFSHDVKSAKANDLIANQGYDIQTAGENLAIGLLTGDTATGTN